MTREEGRGQCSNPEDTTVIKGRNGVSFEPRILSHIFDTANFLPPIDLEKWKKEWN